MLLSHSQKNLAPLEPCPRDDWWTENRAEHGAPEHALHPTAGTNGAELPALPKLNEGEQEKQIPVVVHEMHRAVGPPATQAAGCCLVEHLKLVTALRNRSSESVQQKHDERCHDHEDWQDRASLFFPLAVEHIDEFDEPKEHDWPNNEVPVCLWFLSLLHIHPHNARHINVRLIPTGSILYRTPRTQGSRCVSECGGGHNSDIGMPFEIPYP